jgi:hypothetical protein
MTSKIIPAMNCYSYYMSNRSVGQPRLYHGFRQGQAGAYDARGSSPEVSMRLQLISAAVLAYAILTVAWICYANLCNPVPLP